MQLSAHQREVMLHGEAEATSLFAGGAIRSGKTFSVMWGFALWLASYREPADYAIVGQSVEAIMRNMGFDLVELFNSIDYPARIDRTFGTRITVDTGCALPVSIWCIGANDAKARRRIQGSTLRGLVVEELALLPQDFFNMAWSRLSRGDSKMWASYNPEGPAHWAKKQVIDRADDFNGNIVKFRLRDNPTLEESVISRYESSFSGHFYKRMIEGEWAAADGACFPEWTVKDDIGPLPGGRWHLALDWAVSGVLAALAIHSTGRRSHVLHEFYHDGRKEGVLTEDAALATLDTWARERMGSPAHLPAWVDPATPASFKFLLRKKGYSVRNADNDVVPGIVATSAALARGDCILHQRCAHLQEELAGYVWDETAAERGEDKPVKAHDHACDALRYFCHSTGKGARTLAPVTVKGALNVQ